jgi:hypothetical protein
MSNKSVTFIARNGTEYVLQPAPSQCLECAHPSIMLICIPLNEYTEDLQGQIKTANFTLNICDVCDNHFLSVFSVNQREFFNVFPSAISDFYKQYVRNLSARAKPKPVRERKLSLVQSQTH